MNRCGEVCKEVHCVGEGGNVGESEFEILCYTAKPNAGVREVGGKITIFRTGELAYNSDSTYIVIPRHCNQVDDACAICLLTAPSAPTLCLIRANVRRHSFPIITDPAMWSMCDGWLL
jgi:hypothetical protein